MILNIENGLNRKRAKFRYQSLLTCLFVLSILIPQPAPAAAGAAAGPAIRDISLNAGDYPYGEVPSHEKLEITFQVDTAAPNVQLPFDPAPPPGIQPGIGISVEALFSPDNWKTVFRQPAFYYQAFDDSLKDGREWFYPTENFSWKVRFAPDRAGYWQFKLSAQDASGKFETAAGSFRVVPSANKGFVRVSQKDPRYFEFENGAYFPALGYNMNFSQVDWENPVLGNEKDFRLMSENGIQLARIWLSQWGIYGPSWNPWNSTDPDQYGQYIPAPSLSFEETFPGSEVSMKLSGETTPCMFIGFMKAPPAVKSNATYRIRVRYKITGLSSPKAPGQAFGFVAKTGDWLAGAGNPCQNPGTGTVVTAYQAQNTADWQILEGKFNASGKNFLPNFYLALENAGDGTVWIDHVWIEEELGNGAYGPNIVSKPWMSHHLYFEQRNSYAFDKVLELAEQYGVYLRPVILEKNDWIFNRIDELGNPIPNDPLCRDSDPGNDPERCPGNQYFYGNGREITKVRWLQQAWWRYLQARWGYSTSIHSWELLNEGDPGSGLLYKQADEFGAYMHQFKPDHHLVSVSFWSSFPKDSFWANPQFPDIDFADFHHYYGEDEVYFADTALATYETSLQIGAKQPGGALKPVIRGETGFGPPTDQFKSDTQGVWLHNFIWGGINAGGMIESYWYANQHIYKQGKDGNYTFDHRPHYRAFYNFIQGNPLNNGNYQHAAATVSNESLLVLGQADRAAGRAHLWVANKNHTWKNAAGGSVPAVSGELTLPGLQPGASYTVQWWDTYQPDPSRQIVRTQTLQAGGDGALKIAIENLKTDVALKIFFAQPSGSSHWLYLPVSTR